MFLFKCTGTLVPNNQDGGSSVETLRDYAAITASFNEEHEEKGGCFIESINSDTVEICLVLDVNSRMDTQEKRVDALNSLLKSFVNALGLNVAEVKYQEITFKVLRRMLNRALRTDFINDPDEFLSRMDLDGIPGRGGVFVESILEPIELEEANKETSKLLFDNTLLPELERIYAGKNKACGAGHPVHYFISSNDLQNVRDAADVLLNALYTNERLISQRVARISSVSNNVFLHTYLEEVYRKAWGGSIVLEICQNRDNQDDEYASEEDEMIEIVANLISKYRNDVLTVVCMPEGSKALKERLFRHLTGMTFVELSDQKLSMDKAYAKLKQMASEHKVRPNKALLDLLDENETYTMIELRGIFDKWFDANLKANVYPQYRQISSIAKKDMEKKEVGNAYEELKEMIGLSSAKKVIQQAIDFAKTEKLFKANGIKRGNVSRHMVFTGAPGTAKTSVARLYARILKENGILERGHLVETGRKDLIGKYVGSTAPLVEKMFERARGGVLFIDEAYSLVDDRDGSYGDEAINTIVQCMENMRDDVVVIFAGYEKPMQKFLDKNPGLRSRIAFHVPFVDYDADELADIAVMIAKKKGFTLTDEAVEKVHAHMAVACQNKDFGNGRYARNLIEKAEMAQSSRLANMDFDAINTKVLTTLTDSDFEIEAPASSAEKPHREIGFWAS